MVTKLPKLNLEKWLALNFDPPPSLKTARSWVRQGKIYPMPMKVGRAYYVEHDAVYQDYSITKRSTLLPLAERLRLQDAARDKQEEIIADRYRRARK